MFEGENTERNFEKKKRLTDFETNLPPTFLCKKAIQTDQNNYSTLATKGDGIPQNT